MVSLSLHRVEEERDRIKIIIDDEESAHDNLKICFYLLWWRSVRICVRLLCIFLWEWVDEQQQCEIESWNSISIEAREPIMWNIFTTSCRCCLTALTRLGDHLIFTRADEWSHLEFGALSWCIASSRNCFQFVYHLNGMHLAISWREEHGTLSAALRINWNTERK